MKRNRRQAKAARRQRRLADEASDPQDLLSTGLAQHQAGHLQAAERCYRAVIDLLPTSAPAAHLLARVLCDQKQFEESLRWMERAVQWSHGDPRMLNDLGNLLEQLNRPEGAEQAYRRALQQQPDDGQVRANLCRLLQNMGKTDLAIEEYENAIAADPNDFASYLGLGGLLKSENRLEEAATAFRGAIGINPTSVEGYRKLCAVLAKLGDFQQAADACRGWLEQEPDNPTAQHMLSAYSGANVSDRASDAYIKNLFDEFAETFDEDLQGLSYQGPNRIRDVLAKKQDLKCAPTHDVLDAGCGTGLCGPVLRPYAKRLVGVDLSGEMLARAQSRAVYDELFNGELTAYVAEHPAAFDWIVAADTLIYFGQLDDVFRAIAASLKQGGLFLFTLEEGSNDPSGNEDYRLKEHGRYVHTRAYVDSCLEANGMQSNMVEPFVIREQAGRTGSGPVDHGRPWKCFASSPILKQALTVFLHRLLGP